MATAEAKKIDPTVPLKGIPEDKVESAEWTDYCVERVVERGQKVQRCRRVATINGIQIHSQMGEKNMKKILDLFPRVSTFLPLDEDERRQFIRNRGKRRPAEVISVNGVRYTVPKGVMLTAPLPVAQVIENMVNPIRVAAMAENAAREEFNPLGPDVPYDL